jgi:hypothetical protein
MKISVKINKFNRLKNKEGMKSQVTGLLVKSFPLVFATNRNNLSIIA